MLNNIYALLFLGLLCFYFHNWLSQSNTPSTESAYAVATNDHIELLQSVSQQLGSNSSLSVPS